MATVKLISAAADDVRALDGSARRVVLKAIDELRSHPERRGQPLGTSAIGDLTTFRKLVVGNRDYRIVYRRVADNEVAVVLLVAKRADSEVYRVAVSRLRNHDDPEIRRLAASFGDLMPDE